MDKIAIYEIRFDAHIGVTEEEQEKAQPLSVDLEITGEMSTHSDRLEETIDYDMHCRNIVDLGRQSRVKLIETLAEQMAQTVLQDPKVRSVFVRVKKCAPPHPAIFGGFVVEIIRNRDM